MHILVTGGAGFIGSHIVAYHLKKHDSVHVIDDLSTGNIDNFKAFQDHSNFSFTKGDLLTTPNLDEIVGQADRIYHMAAVVGVLRVIKEYEHLLTTNIVGAERLLCAAKVSEKKPRILLASTSEVYGDTKKNASQESNSLKIGEEKGNCSGYVISKIASEYIGLAYFKHYHVPITMLRLFNTIGPRQTGFYGMVVPRFIDNALRNHPIVVHGTGAQTRSFCDVRDLVAMMDIIANTPSTNGEILNVGNDEEVSINFLASLVKQLTHSDSQIIHIPYEEIYGEGFIDILKRKPDLAKLKKCIQYEYQWDLKKTLLDLIASKKT